MHALAGRLGVGVAAFALACGAATPAYASTYAHVDARHDVESLDSVTRAPANRTADIRRLEVVHSDKAVRFEVRLRSASLKGLRFRILAFSVKTPEDHFSGDVVQSHGAVQYDLLDDTSSEVVTCNESSGHHGNRFWLRLSRSCLGTPRWVRAALTIETINRDGDRWGDNPTSDRWRRAGSPSYGPRVQSSPR